MKKYGGMNIPHSDEFFGPILDRDGGRFDDGALIKALEVWPGRRTAVDIGAHVGTWTKVMAEHFDSVVAIEPVWENFECLQENTGNLGNVVSYCMALGYVTGVLPFAQNKCHNSGTWRVSPGGGLKVASVPLDHFELKEVDLIKMDVEGFELTVLRGAEDTIARCKPILIIEENGLAEDYGYRNRDIQDWLAFRGYCPTAQSSRDVIYMPIPMGGAA